MAGEELFLKGYEGSIQLVVVHSDTTSFKEQLAEMLSLHFHTSPNKSSTVAARYINPYTVNLLA
jgi:hypothetical protein